MLLRGHWGCHETLRKEAARKDALLGVDEKIQEERLRIAEHIVRELRKADFDCSLGDNSLVPTFRRDNWH